MGARRAAGRAERWSDVLVSGRGQHERRGARAGRGAGTAGGEVCRPSPPRARAGFPLPSPRGGVGGGGGGGGCPRVRGRGPPGGGRERGPPPGPRRAPRTPSEGGPPRDRPAYLVPAAWRRRSAIRAAAHASATSASTATSAV